MTYSSTTVKQNYLKGSYNKKEVGLNSAKGSGILKVFHNKVFIRYLYRLVRGPI